jgi:hypothetical protein
LESTIPMLALGGLAACIVSARPGYLCDANHQPLPEQLIKFWRAACSTHASLG